MSSRLLPTQHKGKLGIFHLPRLWSKIKQNLDSREKEKIDKNEWTQDLIIFDELNLGTIEPSVFVCSTNASLEEFENWILEKNAGCIKNSVIEKINKAIVLNQDEHEDYTPLKTVLTKEDLEFFNTYGYVIVKDVISKNRCKETIDETGKFLGLDLSVEENWYKADSGFWLKMYHSEILTENRNNEKIKIAYQQLLKSDDLFCSYDRVSINPPQTDSFEFNGPDLHWDASLNRPMPFGLQGLLYLTNVKENGGAFSCVPGFHKKIESWLEQFEDESQARNFDLHSLDVKQISANAGDFIIWDDRLPHGASANLSCELRVVQYINMYSPRKVYNNTWK
ncbi:MAG: hypothetical protein GQ474_02930 [Sulfurimonas sp.]|nr:hypothetical protein [Sulfurimonas sp.]